MPIFHQSVWKYNPFFQNNNVRLLSNDVKFRLQNILSSVKDIQQEKKMKENQKLNSFPFTEFNAVFEKDFSGKIILKSSDEAFLHLNSLNSENIGQDITGILSKTEAELCDYYYSCYQGRRYYLSFVRNYPNYNNILWMVDAVIDFNTINLNGILLDSSSNDLSDIFASHNESEKIINSYILACGRIKLTKNSAYFSDINDYLTILLKQNRISKSCILNSCIYRNCIQRRISSVGMIRYFSECGFRPISAYENGAVDINPNDCRCQIETCSMEYHYIVGLYPFIIDNEVSEIQFFLIPFDSAGIISEDVIETLTPRENTILRLTAEGLNLSEIAHTLCISEHTAKTILYNSFRKINVSNKTEAVLKFYGLK